MRLLKLLLVLLCFIFATYGTAQAQSKTKPTRRTVRDYYLRLPSEYFTDSARENLRSRAMVVDIRNDYIETAGDAGQPYLQTAVFRYRGSELFAVNAQFEMGSTLKFYRFYKGKLSDVTGKVWPVKLRATDRVYLPRYGTTIIVRDENVPVDQKPRLTIRWRGGRFVK